MTLPKHPKLMNDDELCIWVQSLIERKAPESSSLDYKAEISIDGRPKRIELGKDVSSFANEGGGILLYGVPEEKEQTSGVPIPKSLSGCGINIAEDLPEKIENILLDIVVPPLPELYIKVLNLEELNPKSLLMIYHPESWNKPHMIEGYKDARYYRRGNYRAIIMNERQVEAAYLFRKVSLAHAEDFFKTGDFRTIPGGGRFLRIIFCPRFTLTRKKEMREAEFINWLDKNTPGGCRVDRSPFLNGWSLRVDPKGEFYGKQYELRLFHNGAISFNMDLSWVILENLIYLQDLEEKINRKFLPYANEYFKFLGILGPLSTQVNFYNVRNLEGTHIARRNEHNYFVNDTKGPTPIDKEEVSFVEELSAEELRFHPDVVLKRLMDRLASAFGIWRK